MRRLFAGVLSVALLAAAVSADPPPTTGYYTTPTYPGVGTAVAVPVYTAVYTAGDPQAADVVTAIRELTAEVKALRTEVAALRSQPPQFQALKAAPPAADALSIAKQFCTACHSSQKVADEKGGGFVMFNQAEQFVTLEPDARQRIVRRVLSNGGGVMPPKPVLPPTPSDRTILAEFFRKGELR